MFVCLLVNSTPCAVVSPLSKQSSMVVCNNILQYISAVNISFKTRLKRNRILEEYEKQKVGWKSEILPGSWVEFCQQQQGSSCSSQDRPLLPRGSILAPNLLWSTAKTWGSQCIGSKDTSCQCSSSSSSSFLLRSCLMWSCPSCSQSWASGRGSPPPPPWSASGPPAGGLDYKLTFQICTDKTWSIAKTRNPRLFCELLLVSDLFALHPTEENSASSRVKTCYRLGHVASFHLVWGNLKLENKGNNNGMYRILLWSI